MAEGLAKAAGGGPPREAKRRLTAIFPEEVSLVDRAANGKVFIVRKRDKEEPMNRSEMTLQDLLAAVRPTLDRVTKADVERVQKMTGEQKLTVFAALRQVMNRADAIGYLTDAYKHDDADQTIPAAVLMALQDLQKDAGQTLADALAALGKKNRAAKALALTEELAKMAALDPAEPDLPDAVEKAAEEKPAEKVEKAAEEKPAEEKPAEKVEKAAEEKPPAPPAVDLGPVLAELKKLQEGTDAARKAAENAGQAVAELKTETESRLTDLKARVEKAERAPVVPVPSGSSEGDGAATEVEKGDVSVFGSIMPETLRGPGLRKAAGTPGASGGGTGG